MSASTPGISLALKRAQNSAARALLSAIAFIASLMSAFDDLLPDLRLDELREQRQRVLPAQVAHLGWNRRRYSFLDDAQLRADGYFLQRYGGLHLSRQVRIVECVGVADALV